MLREGVDPINLFYPHNIYCGCPQPLPEFPKSYGFYYVQRFEVRGDFIIIGGIVDNHCLNFIFINVWSRRAIGPNTTKVVISNPAHGEVYSIQHYAMKLVSDLRQYN
jgi:hypothetical protein